MKKLLSYIVPVLLLFTASCDKGLESLNKNETSPLAVDPALLLNQAIINTSYPVKTLVFDMGIVQQIVSPNGGVLAGANFNQDSRDITTPPVWAAYYQGVIKNTHLAIYYTKDDPTRSNLYNMARIWQAYTFMILTDEYGDIPYTDAGAGFTERNPLPKYDSQEEIYPRIMQELTQAAAALDAGGVIENSDLLYAGNIDKWKKFAYSLLLRAGMRLSKVNPTLAQSTVQAAVAGGGA